MLTNDFIIDPQGPVVAHEDSQAICQRTFVWMWHLEDNEHWNFFRSYILFSSQLQVSHIGVKYSISYTKTTKMHLESSESNNPNPNRTDNIEWIGKIDHEKSDLAIIDPWTQVLVSTIDPHMLEYWLSHMYAMQSVDAGFILSSIEIIWYLGQN
jgi:hypothetical protein